MTTESFVIPCPNYPILRDHSEAGEPFITALSQNSMLSDRRLPIFISGGLN
jgi:hypothetical protein